LIAVITEYEVLLCVSPKYRKAVSPACIVKHLCKIHKEKSQIRRQVQEFAAGIPREYDYLNESRSILSRTQLLAIPPP
jgi:hypothetical protein